MQQCITGQATQCNQRRTRIHRTLWLQMLLQPLHSHTHCPNRKKRRTFKLLRVLLPLSAFFHLSLFLPLQLMGVVEAEKVAALLSDERGAFSVR